MTNRIQYAIDQSIATDSIVRLDDVTTAELGELTMCGDNGVESDGVYETWGADNEGYVWRVHARLA